MMEVSKAMASGALKDSKILYVSGEESLAQVNRELEYPKHKNLMRAGW